MRVCHSATCPARASGAHALNGRSTVARTRRPNSRVSTAVPDRLSRFAWPTRHAPCREAESPSGGERRELGPALRASPRGTRRRRLRARVQRPGRAGRDRLRAAAGGGRQAQRHAQRPRALAQPLPGDALPVRSRTSRAVGGPADELARRARAGVPGRERLGDDRRHRGVPRPRRGTAHRRVRRRVADGVRGTAAPTSAGFALAAGHPGRRAGRLRQPAAAQRQPQYAPPGGAVPPGNARGHAAPPSALRAPAYAPAARRTRPRARCPASAAPRRTNRAAAPSRC